MKSGPPHPGASIKVAQVGIVAKIPDVEEKGEVRCGDRLVRRKEIPRDGTMDSEEGQQQVNWRAKTAPKVL